ncbi:MAG TPA: oligosaccharide flippase family protein [Candidatus Paceibacterota bacterium]|nr:oligosaccharide flippase family protein [Candidatus Paceibacterota bacterium]
MLSKFCQWFRENYYEKWSFLVMAGALVASGVNYVFALIMGRLLGPGKFGEIVTLFGLLIIFGVPATALTMFVSKHVPASGFASKSLFRLLTKIALISGLGLVAIFWFFIPRLSVFLNIEPIILFIFSLIIPISFVSSVSIGVLQGLKNFFSYSLQGVITAASKLILAVVFVLFGFLVPGVMLALFFSYLISYFYTLRQIKPSLQKENDKSLNLRPLARDFVFILFVNLLLAILSNIDVILAKHYLSPSAAGEYAALSTIGKILLYGTSAFVAVMFPLVAEAKTQNSGREHKIISRSLPVIFLISFLVVLFFSFFPQLTVKIFFGAKYLAIAPFLPLFGASMGMIAMAIALVHFFVATNRKIFAGFFLAAIIFQIIFIALAHQNIEAFVKALFWSSLFLTGSMFLNYLFVLKPKYAFKC